MKNVLVVGCNGFIGKKFIEYLINKDYYVVGMDIQEKAHCNYNNYTYIKLSFNDDTFNVIKEMSIDTVYYLSWIGVSSVDKNNPKKQLANIELTYEMLEFVNKLGINRLVIPGSMSEFSKCNTHVTGYENDSPSDLYAATKVAIRKLAYQFCEKNHINLNWLLITSVYSSDRIDANLMTYTINNLLEDKMVECTKLEQKWDYISDVDLIEAMYLIGLNGEYGKIYPIGSGEVHQLSYYVKFIANYLQKTELIKIGAIPYKNKYIDNSMPNIEKIREIGYVSKTKYTNEIVNIIEKIKKQKGVI